MQKPRASIVGGESERCALIPEITGIHCVPTDRVHIVPLAVGDAGAADHVEDMLSTRSSAIWSQTSELGDTHAMQVKSMLQIIRKLTKQLMAE